MSVFAITITIGFVFIAAILAGRSRRPTPEGSAAAVRPPRWTTPDFSELEVAPTSREIFEQLCSRSDE